MSEYDDTHEERVRELTETGSSVRRTGKGILQLLREAMQPENEDFRVCSDPTTQT